MARKSPPNRPLSRKWRMKKVVLPKVQDIEDAQLTTSCYMSCLLRSGDSEWINPDLEYWDSHPEFGVPGVLTDIDAIGENHAPPEQILW